MEKLKNKFHLYVLLDKFLNDPILPPHFLYLPCQICGSERASPREGITHAIHTHLKGTVSLNGEGHP